MGFPKPAGQKTIERNTSGPCYHCSSMIFNTFKKRKKRKKKYVKVGPRLFEEMFDIGKNGKKKQPNNNRKTMQSSSTCKNITVCTNNCVY